jgi:uncharacterized protein YndB with AHSA1/START domain
VKEMGEITCSYDLRFERKSKHSAERLWRAITEPGEVGHWMNYPARIELRVGGDYCVDFSRTSDGSLDGVIVRLEPARKLAYAWGLSVVEWTLEPDGEGCRYTMVHAGLRRDLANEELVAGWHLFLDDFAGHLEGAHPSTTRARDSELRFSYKERLDEVLGPAA